MQKILIVNAVFATVHGLAFVLMPVFALNFYGVTVGPGEQVMGQLFGAGLLTVALMCGLGQGLADRAALRVIGVALCIPYAVGAVVTAMATFKGVMNVFGWLGIAIYAGLAVAYALALLSNGNRALGAVKS